MNKQMECIDIAVLSTKVGRGDAENVRCVARSELRNAQR